MFDKELSFEQIKEDYFSHAYGENWCEIAEYLEKIGNMFDVKYLEYQHRGAAKSYVAPERVDGMLPKLQELTRSIYRVRTVAGQLLMYHAEYCKLLSEPCALKAEGKDAEALECFERAMDKFGRNEIYIERYYDHHLANSAFRRKMFKK